MTIAVTSNRPIGRAAGRAPGNTGG